MIVDDTGAAVADYSTLDLVPFTTNSSIVVKDPDSGLDIFRDPLTGVDYFREVTASGDRFSIRTTDSGRYPFSVYNSTLRTFETLYSTTDVFGAGTLFTTSASNGIRVLADVDPAYAEPVFVLLNPVSDAAIIARLVPLTLKDFAGGQPTGASIALNEATVGTVANSITLRAHGQINTSNLTVSSSTGSIIAHGADDLLLANWTAPTIDVTTTGFFDVDGAYAGGSIELPAGKTLSTR